MTTRWSVVPRRFRCCATVAWLCAVGCGPSADDIFAPKESETARQAPEALVCGFCQPTTGGETTDFDDPPACAGFYLTGVADASTGADAGLDFEKIKTKVETDVDAALTWTAGDVGPGNPVATGYEDGARVHVNLRVRSSTLSRLDPARCDGASCVDPLAELSYTQGDCHPAFISFEIDAIVTTSDGAISASGSGTASYIVLESALGGAISFGGTVEIDLIEVTGQLRISPPDDPGHYAGRLRIALDLRPELASGSLSIELRSAANRYTPLFGNWTE